MKRLLLLVTLLPIISIGQIFDVDTLMWNGPESNRVNLIILGDGYTVAQQTDFLSDAALVSDAIFNTIPFTVYKDYFNVIAIKVISAESGASHAGNSSDNACGSEPVAVVDNYFGSSFDCGNGSYHRLLCATKSYLIPGVLAANWPAYDQVLVITNTPFYGGAGGQYAVSSMHPTASEIAIHEVGHSYANLADEYWAGSVYATNSRPNMTNNSDISTVKWSEWVGTENTGLYPHSGDPSWFKPVNGQCKMEFLGTGYPFCPVCREAHILRTLDLTEPFDSYTPATSPVPDILSDVFFDIETVRPDPNTLKIIWDLNGTPVKSGLEDTLTILYGDFQAGMNTVQATLLDTSELIRHENHVSAHTYSITWNINKTGLGIEGVETATDDLYYELFPNPTQSISYFHYTVQSPGEVLITLTDLQGKELSVLDRGIKTGDQYLEINWDRLGLSSGVYVLTLRKNGQLMVSERISVN